MRRFRSILVVAVTDRSEPPPALREAVDLARDSGAQLAMLGIVAPVPREPALADADLGAFRASVMHEARDRFVRWAVDAATPELPIDVVDGSPPGEVARRVREHGHDLVVIAHDESGESVTLARRIVRVCPCPVWLTGPGSRASRVLAAIDPGHDDRRNRLILQLAASQAELHGGVLHVMHAWRLPEAAATIVDAVEADVRQRLESTITEARLGVEPSIHLVDGSPGRAVQGSGVLYRADLVVIGAGDGDVPELGIGSTTEQVLAEWEGAVLVVR